MKATIRFAYSIIAHLVAFALQQFWILRCCGPVYSFLVFITQIVCN